jgi:hypothetical protein
VDLKTGAQVAKLSGRVDIAIFVGYIEKLCKYYNDASVLVERNNHGHAVIKLLLEHHIIKVLLSDQDEKDGWNDNQRGKTLLYDHLTDTVRTQDCLIFDIDTHDQIASIEGSSLRAPKGLHDDDADSYALAQLARMFAPRDMELPGAFVPRAGLDTYVPR